MGRQLLRTALAVCVLSSQSAGAQELVSTDDELTHVIRAGNQFAAELFGRLSAGRPANVFCSPQSIYDALAMTYGGAEGETRQQMAETLHFTLPPDRLHAAIAQLRLSAPCATEQEGFTLRAANRLWGQQGYHFLAAFLQLTHDQYGAELAQVDFTGETEKARQAMNSWVAEQTDHKIEDLVALDLLPATTRLALTNAIYVKGQWTHAFPTAATKDARFQTLTGKPVAVPMMSLEAALPYASDSEVQVVDLPYGQDARFSMLIVLPKKVDGIAALSKRLSSGGLEKWWTNLKPQIMRLYLPRFKIGSEFSLTTVLESMGMTLPFDPQQANLSGISTEERLALDAVIHKAELEVNEEGTVAAAATAVIAAPKAAPAPKSPPVVFLADHPFLLMIRDSKNERVLFIGQIANPSE